MNVPPQLKVTPQPNTKWWQSLQETYQQLARALNGNVEFGNPASGPANIKGNWVSVSTPGAANTDFTITHNLGRPLVGYVICTKNATCDIYTSPTANANPNTQYILRATVATVSLTLFVF